MTEKEKDFYNKLKECLDTANGTPFQKEKAVHDWIVLNCKYDHDNFIANTVPNSSYHPEGVFVHGTAVCQGYAESFQLCMDILGIPCKTITGTANGGGHAWNAVELDDEWYMVDVTWDDPVPDTPGSISYSYFNVTDEKLKRDHEYTSEINATGTKYYHYATLDNYFTDKNKDAYYEYINQTLSSAETVSAIIELTDATKFTDENIQKGYMDFSKVNVTGGEISVSCKFNDYVAVYTWTKK